MRLRCDSQLTGQCFASESALVQSFGPEQARIVARRITELQAAPCLADLLLLPQLQLQRLNGDQDGKIAIRAGQDSHLVFMPLKDPAGHDLDWMKVTEISISGIMKLSKSSLNAVNA